MKSSIKWLVIIVSILMLVAACSTGSDPSSAAPASDTPTVSSDPTTTVPVVITDPTAAPVTNDPTTPVIETPAAQSVGMMPQIFGKSGTLVTPAVQRSIAVVIDEQTGYSGLYADNTILAQISSPAVTGWTNSAFPPIGGQVFHYTVLTGTSGNGTPYGKGVTVKVTDNDDGTYTFSGTFDEDNLTNPDSAYDSKKPSWFTIVLNYANKTYTFSQEIFIDEYGYKANGETSYGWLWDGTCSGSGTFSSTTCDATGTSRIMFTDRKTGVLVPEPRDFTFTYRSRPLINFAEIREDLLLSGVHTDILLYQNPNGTWEYADSNNEIRYPKYLGYWNDPANQ